MNCYVSLAGKSLSVIQSCSVGFLGFGLLVAQAIIERLEGEFVGLGVEVGLHVGLVMLEVADDVLSITVRTEPVLVGNVGLVMVAVGLVEGVLRLGELGRIVTTVVEWVLDDPEVDGLGCVGHGSRSF